jgi:hypothetical protein
MLYLHDRPGAPQPPPESERRFMELERSCAHKGGQACGASHATSRAGTEVARRVVWRRLRLSR